MCYLCEQLGYRWTVCTTCGIEFAYGRYAPIPSDERVLYPVPGSAELTAVARVDGTETGASPLNFNGYLVDLEFVTKTT